ncbi:MAG: winged helix-turn-helix transcriptional regulator [Candidatus Hydrogenedentes bacterium]|nr:winged helix-turn-helix transcriptional regulator [Candidatus Hydrogenedentota bacterium]
MRNFKAGIFQALAHPTRVAIAEILSGGECSAGAILEQLDLEQANVSQHLSVLRAKGLVSSRKEGNQVFYSLKHPLVAEVLEVSRLYFLQHLAEATEMLQAITEEELHRIEPE